MIIYIASSWKNRHAVEMLTKFLRCGNHEVLSFVENNHGEETAKARAPLNLDEWIASPKGEQSFSYDTRGAIESDLVIYIGVSGCDAWAEVGAAWSAGVPIFGLLTKGEQVGLMRRMICRWFEDFRDLLAAVQELTLQRIEGVSDAVRLYPVLSAAGAAAQKVPHGTTEKSEI
jgi:hypothetical protein